MAGANTCELAMPLSDVIVTGVRVVGSERVVARHGLVIVIMNPIYA